MGVVGFNDHSGIDVLKIKDATNKRLDG